MKHFPWQFDARRQVIITGWLQHTISFSEIATWIQDRIHHRHDLTGPWAGWRVRGRFLIGPQGRKITPERLREAVKLNETTE